MKSLRRNKSQMLIKHLTSEKKPIINEEGNFTGDYEKVYSEEIPFQANICFSGEIVQKTFGRSDEYEGVIYGTGNCPFQSNDTIRVLNSDGFYIVSSIIKSLNAWKVAIKRGNSDAWSTNKV